MPEMMLAVLACIVGLLVKIMLVEVLMLIHRRKNSCSALYDILQAIGAVQCLWGVGRK